MAQLITPQRPKSSVGALGTIAGAVIGGLAGGEGGRLAGASLGSSLGGAAGGMADGGSQQTAVPANGSGSSAAMARRSQQLAQDNLATLTQAEQQLPTLPEPLRQQYGPAIMQARYMEQRSRGMA